MGIVKSDYVSAHTLWINEQLAKNPQWAAEQKAGRALWWDKKQDTEVVRRNAESKVAQKPYPYDVNFYGE